jgi:superfamily II DNA or RNA helicase
MIKTVYNRLAKSINVKKDLAKFDVIAVDECHMAGSKIYSKVLQNVPAPVRVFVSGTPFDSDAILNKMIAIGLSGPEVVKVTKRELMDKGISLNVKVHMHLCYPYSKKEPSNYNEHIQNCIHFSVNRASIMWNVMEANRVPTLISVEEIAHGKFIFDAFYVYQQLGLLDGTKNKDNYLTVSFVHGTDPDREIKIKRFNAGELDVLITTRILKEGVNMPRANQLIYALGGKSGVNVKQWMGRIERTDGKASEVLMHDFYDLGQFVEGHSRKRLKVYRKENIEIVKTPSRKEIQEIKRQLLVK